MSNLIKHKRVEYSELFYDLVFVYAISKTTCPYPSSSPWSLIIRCHLWFPDDTSGFGQFLDDSDRLYQPLWKEFPFQYDRHVHQYGNVALNLKHDYQ